MAVLRVLYPDQLSRGISSLSDLDPAADLVLLAETRTEASYVRHHKQKLVLQLSALRHFVAELRELGWPVHWVPLEAPENSGTIWGEVRRILAQRRFDRIVLTEPADWRQQQDLHAARGQLELEIEVRPDQRFLCSRQRFADWAAGRRQLRMEYFYREMRKSTGWLMEAQQPLGGRWNFDRENRKPLEADHRPPPLPRFVPDALTREVMTLVENAFPEHFGSLETFAWAVTRSQARQALDWFVSQALPCFGDYQDAMKTGEDFLYHSALSPYLNLGLLQPREVCEAALAAWEQGQAPLNAVEGFIRQILGWREYVRGLYWLKMPAYAQSNYLEAHRPLPAFYWHGETDLNCLRQCIRATARNAYAHHIQRLMVTGNFALLAGLEPAQVEEWYLSVYADAFDWVELPNTHGMVLYADGGEMASKPYAASGAYIRRMSDYCQGCAYDPALKSGEQACPLNYLYWDFLLRNRQKLQKNPRLAMPYRSLEQFSDARIAQIQADAAHFLARLDSENGASEP